ncbi:MAG: hypothetical protein QHH09_03855 [Microgenomates group bacterium]|jgi:type II secretory pathway pseudopilin PulG|nr:hypothetical protein [Microgenomates group bacterium]
MFLSKKSFTLIEIIIVIFLLSLLTLLSLIGVGQQLKKARDSKRKYDLNLLAKSLEEYFDYHNCYIANLPPCNSEFNIKSEKILSAIPCDPKNNSNYIYVSDGQSCSSYFKIYTNLEIASDPIVDFIGCRGGCGPNCSYNYGVSSPNVSLDYCQPTPIPPTVPTLPATPTPIQYVCSPGGGQQGVCEPFAIPTLSECPYIFPGDSTCQSKCSIPSYRCKNSKGKYVPTKAY